VNRHEVLECGYTNSCCFAARGAFSEFLIDEKHPTHGDKFMNIENARIVYTIGKTFRSPPQIDL